MLHNNDFSRLFFSSDSGNKMPPNLDSHNIKFIRQIIYAFFEHAMEYVCILDKELRIVAYNQRFKKKISNNTKAAISFGSSFLDFIPGDRKELWKNQLSKAQEGKEVNFEEKFESQSKETFVTRFRLYPLIFEENVEGILIFADEVTEEDKYCEILKEKEETFKALTENIKSAVFTFTDDGFFVYVNPAAETITGYSYEELQKMHFYDLIHPDYREMTKKRGLERLKGKDVESSYEIKIISKNGEEKWIEISNSKILIKNKNLVLGTAIDITDRKKIENDLKIESAYLENLFESSPEAIVVTNNEGYIEKINKEFTRLFQYSEDEALGKHVDDLLAPKGYFSEAQNKTKIVADGKRVAAETMRVRKDGTPIQVSILGAPVEIEGRQRSVYGIYRDITERIKSEKALKESKTQLQYVLNNTNDVIFQMDLQGNFIFINKAAVDLTGYSMDEFLKKHYSEVVDEDFYEMIRTRLEQRKQNEDIPETFKVKIIKKNGEKFWSEISTKPIFIDAELTGIQGVVRDISEQMKFEKQLKEAKEKAEEADHLKSSFLANMSHEIRTPMNAILGFSQLLKDPDLEEDEISEYVDIINSRGNHLLQIINDIIDLSKIEANQLKIANKEVNLNKLMDELYHIYEQELENANKDEVELILKKGLNEEEALIFSDKIRLQQIIINILTNAIKYTDKGYIEFGYYLEDISNKDYLKFYIKDTGKGIPKEKHDIIFERFRQSDETKTREHGGTGLGLSISEGLVQLLNGDIWFESEEGKGTTFYFIIPYLAKNPKRNKKTNKLETMEYKWDNKTILIVEDDLLSAKFLEALIIDTNANVLIAKSGKEAIEMIKEKEAVDLILMDIQLPEIDGHEATKQIKDISPEIPVIVQTAHAMAEDRRKSLESGCDDYLTKPINQDLLMEKIQEFIG